MHRRAFLTGAALLTALAPLSSPASAASGTTVWVLTKDGRSIEGTMPLRSLKFKIGQQVRDIPISQVLSYNNGDNPSTSEAAAISRGLPALQGTDRRARDMASDQLCAIGLPALTPLLDAFKDTDLREPNPSYRLLARIMPGYADQLNRSEDMLRLKNGDVLRGKLQPQEAWLSPAGEGRSQHLHPEDIRRLAVRQAQIDRTFDVHSLRHCTQIEYLDSGVVVTPASRVTEDARGFTRLSGNEDGWTSDPDGMPLPGPRHNSNIEDGFRFGALLGRVGATGERWMAGKHAEKTGLPLGRLYFAINDSPHWQNNIGAYRVRLRVTDAYDLGEAQ